jgi:hypothetical protein
MTTPRCPVVRVRIDDCAARRKIEAAGPPSASSEDVAAG